MSFEIISDITEIETIAAGVSIRDLDRLQDQLWIDTMTPTPLFTPKYAICVNNTDYPASLELHKLYRLVPDDDAGVDGDLRVIDESGEDYLYPADYFLVVEFPQAIQRELQVSFARTPEPA